MVAGEEEEVVAVAAVVVVEEEDLEVGAEEDVEEEIRNLEQQKNLMLN